VKEYIPELFTPNVLCASSVVLFQSTCKGDSGGPLMIFDSESETYFQIGAVAGMKNNTVYAV